MSVFVALFAGTGSAFAQRAMQKFVAVIETQQSATVEELSKEEIGRITARIRGAAVNNLPGDRYSIMTSQAIRDKAKRDDDVYECLEENCMLALGRKIDANYVVYGTVAKFKGNIELNVEMYMVLEDGGKLVASTTVETTDMNSKFLRDVEAACVEMYRNFLGITGVSAAPQSAAAQTPAPAPAVSPPPPPRTYTLRVNAKPTAGGKVERDPNQPSYDAGTSVKITAVPSAGYYFTGWSEISSSTKDSVIAIRMNSSLTLTANYKKIYTTATKIQWGVRWGGVAMAVGGAIGGVVVNGQACDEYDNNYDEGSGNRNTSSVTASRERVERLVITRNVLYTLGGIGLSGFTLSWFF